MDLTVFRSALEPIAEKHRNCLLAFQAFPELERRRRDLQEVVAQNNSPTPTEVPLPRPPKPPPKHLNAPTEYFTRSKYSEERETECDRNILYWISLDKATAEYWFLMAVGKGRDFAERSTVFKRRLRSESRKWADDVEDTIAKELGRALTEEEKINFWYLEAEYWGDESEMWQNYVKGVHCFRHAGEIPPRGTSGCNIQRDYFNDRLNPGYRPQR